MLYGSCGSLRLVDNTRNRDGMIHSYLMWVSHNVGLSDYAQQTMLIRQVERLIERLFIKAQINSETIELSRRRFKPESTK